MAEYAVSSAALAVTGELTNRVFSRNGTQHERRRGFSNTVAPSISAGRATSPGSPALGSGSSPPAGRRRTQTPMARGPGAAGQTDDAAAEQQLHRASPAPAGMCRPSPLLHLRPGLEVLRLDADGESSTALLLPAAGAARRATAAASCAACSRASHPATLAEFNLANGGAPGRLIEKYGKDAATSKKLQRLEMLLIKINSVIEASEKLTIENLWLRRWRDKLKEAASRGDEVLASFPQCTNNTNADQQQGDEAASSSAAAVPTKVVRIAVLNRIGAPIVGSQIVES